MVHTRKLTAKDRATFAALYPEKHAGAIAVEETLKQLFQSGALRGIVQHGSLPPRTSPVPEGRLRNPITGAF